MKVKTRTRRFAKTRIALEMFTRYAQEVIDAIEYDTVMVVRPDDESALYGMFNERGEYLVDACCTIDASIREWLPVVCQFIRWELPTDSCDRDKEGDVLAYYRSNAAEVLWPCDLSFPQGPAALVAGIAIPYQTPTRLPDDPTTQMEALQCIIAHELVHAFHAMRFVVPAFMDWRTFQQAVLRDGCACDLLQSNVNERSLCLDD